MTGQTLSVKVVYMFLSDEIREMRTALGLSQEELAARAEISVRTVSRIELGTVTPHQSTLQRIALALGESADFFVGIDWGYERALDQRIDFPNGIGVIA